MKAKQIRKLRKRLGPLRKYTIQESAGLFGDFNGYNRIGLRMHEKHVNAGNALRAIDVYMKKYRNERKKINEYQREYYFDTTEQWGKIKVTTPKGSQRYFR